MYRIGIRNRSIQNYARARSCDFLFLFCSSVPFSKMMSIPGFYYDPIKKKYFAIGSASSASTTAEQQYTQTAINNKRRQEEKDREEAEKKQRLLARSQLLPKQQNRITLLQSRCIYGREINADTLKTGAISRLKYKSEFNFGTRGVIKELSRANNYICFGMLSGDLSLMNMATQVQIPHSATTATSELTSCVLREHEDLVFIISTELENGVVRIHDKSSEVYRHSMPGVTLFCSDIVPGQAFGMPLHLICSIRRKWSIQQKRDLSSSKLFIRTSRAYKDTSPE
jgi:hypothetical protein